MPEVAEVEKEDIFKRETTVLSPWADPDFNKVDNLGGEPGFKVDDIPERLGLIQQGQEVSSDSVVYFTDLEDAPNNYGTKLQFLQTDGKGKLDWAWPFWSKSGSTVYYRAGKVAVGHAAAQTIFHISKGEETIASRISCKISPWQEWECLDSNYGFAWGIAADDKKFHLHYDTPMGTVSVHGICFDALNSRIGILDDTPSYPCDIGGNTQIQGTLDITSHVSIHSKSEVRFYDNGNYVGFVAPDLGADQIWVLPNADAPAANQCIKSDSAGNLGWSQPLGVGDSPTFVRLNITGGIISIETTDNYVFTDVLPGAYAGAVGNIAIGKDCGQAITSGDFNICIGYEAGMAITTGLSNICVGQEAGKRLVGGSRNFFFGYRAGSFCVAGIQNVSMGYDANVTGIGSNNFALGYFALRALTTGGNNVAIGTQALQEAGGTSRNTAIGMAAGLYQNTGHDNIYVGFHAGEQDDGNRNLYIGTNCGILSGTSSYNVAIGYRAFIGVLAGVSNYNVSIGYESGFGINAGDNNVFIGAKAGYHVTSGIGNVCIGYYAGETNLTTGNNQLWIANSNTAAPLIYGEFDNALLKLNADTYVVDKDLIVPKTSGKGIKVDTGTPTFGWRDLLGDVFARNTGGSKPSFTTYRDTLLDYQFSVGDEEYFKFHIPHDYVAGTDIHLHVHWSHTSAAVTGGTVTFEYEISYAKGHNQAVFGASVGTTFNGTAATGAGGQYKHIITEVQISAGTPDGNQIDSDDLEPDGVIIARLDLNANNMTGATPSPFVHYVDIHYQSTNIGTKDKVPDFYA